jgi:hypothetical protein
MGPNGKNQNGLIEKILKATEMEDDATPKSTSASKVALGTVPVDVRYTWKANNNNCIWYPFISTKSESVL